MPLQPYHTTSAGLLENRVWIGTWSLGGEMYGRSDARESVQLIRRAFDAGLFFYDTAGFYAHGQSEMLLAKALAGHRREVFLCTKGGLQWQGRQVVHDASSAALRRQLAESLERLKSDYLDMYMLHWPSPQTPLEESLATLQALQREGLIRHYGVCNLTAEQVAGHLAPGGLIAHQVPFNPLRLENEQLLAAGRAAQRCLNCIISPLEQGLLSGSSSAQGLAALGKRDIRQRNPRFHDPAALATAARCREQAHSCGVAPSTWALAWLLARDDVDVVIPGPRTLAQLGEIEALASSMS